MRKFLILIAVSFLLTSNTYGQTPLMASNSREVGKVFQDRLNTLECFFKMPSSAKEHGKEGFSLLRDKVLASMANVPERNREIEATKLLEKLYKHIPTPDDGRFTRLAHGKKPHPLEIVDGKVRLKENWEALVEERVKSPSRHHS